MVKDKGFKSQESQMVQRLQRSRKSDGRIFQIWFTLNDSNSFILSAYFFVKRDSI